MKTFYTERDIEDMHAAGVSELAVDDDVVLTDLARERVMDLGITLKPVDKRQNQAERVLNNLGANLSSPHNLTSKVKPSAGSASAQACGCSTDAELVDRIKSGVIAKLGTTEYNGLLDQIIPQVLARLDSTEKSSEAANTSPQSNRDY